jgi:hypothetical protein
MFWTTHEIQKLILDFGIEVNAEESATRLVQAFVRNGFPIHIARYAAMLSHKSAQELFIPQWTAIGWSESEAYDRYLEWINKSPDLETYCRQSRPSAMNKSTNGGTNFPFRNVPAWYIRYITSQHFQEVKLKAEARWRSQYPQPTSCVIKARHPYQEAHHRDYGAIGSDDEYEWLVPLCTDCHAHIRTIGPGVSAACPETVKRWIDELEAMKA